MDARTDIYSFGASLYWALTGQKVPTYFTVTKFDRDLVKHQRFPTPAELRPEVSEDLSKLVMQCVMYDPDRRVSDMATVLSVLQPMLQPAAPPAPEPTPEPVIPPTGPKRRRVADWGLENV